MKKMKYLTMERRKKVTKNNGRGKRWLGIEREKELWGPLKSEP